MEETDLGYPEIPPDAEIIVADERGHTDSWKKERGEVYMWSWIGGPGWFYVKDVPLPKQYKGRIGKK